MRDIFPVFIKAVLFHRVGLSNIIQTKEKYYFSVDKRNLCWCTGVPWYNTTICQNLHGSIFEDFFVTLRQDIYELMCGLQAYYRLNNKLSYANIFGGVIPLSEYSTINSLVYPYFSLNFINIWLKSFADTFA